MKILMISSEAVPYAQTGGLGDVVGSLSTNLAEKGHHVTLIIPFYRLVRQNRSILNLHSTLTQLTVNMGDADMWCRIWETSPSSRFQVFFIEYNQYFNRPSIYDDGREAYPDNGVRFAFLSKAALDLAVKLKLRPDIVHAHDWQTALVPYYLKTWYWDQQVFKNTASVLTIHNMGYQGQFTHSISRFIGLNWMQLRSDEFEDHGGLNLLKGGIFYADQITTVSPTYAKEILSEPGGCGLSFYLNRRKGDIEGILNGIDDKEWNSRHDSYIPANYSSENMGGKAVCKKELQKRFGLKVDPKIPIFGIVSRMAHQKGLNLLMDCAEQILEWELQLVVLGSGDPFYSSFFGHLPKEYPGKVGTYIGFQTELAHLIEAGSDFFIMPSLYEPCGLNQIFSMLYGTLPIVRATGGLNDTVRNLDENTNKGNGFVFYDIKAEALKNTVGWALFTWYNNKKAYKAMQIQAMQQDFSWGNAIEKYEMIYQKALDRKKNWS